MAAEDQGNGYTIMSIPRIAVNDLAGAQNEGPGDEKSAKTLGRDFILWKASSL